MVEGTIIFYEITLFLAGVLVIFLVLSSKIIATLKKFDAFIEDAHKNTNSLSLKAESLMELVEQKASSGIAKMTFGSFLFSTVLKLFKKNK